MNNESVDHNQANTGQLAGGQQNDNANSSNQNTNSCYLLLSDLQWKQYLCKSSKQRNLNFIEVGEGEKERERSTWGSGRGRSFGDGREKCGDERCGSIVGGI